jgi:hypothetical protein
MALKRTQRMPKNNLKNTNSLAKINLTLLMKNSPKQKVQFIQ